MASKRTPAKAWTEGKQQAAEKGQYYIKIGDKRGNLRLTGAEKKWKESPNYVYVPSLRVAGFPADIEAVFEDLGVSADKVRQHIARGYTASSAAGPLKAEFEAEVAVVKAAAKKEKKEVVAYAGPSIAQYAEMVDKATVEGGRAPARGRSKSPKKAKSPGRPKSKSPKKAKSKSPKARKSPAKGKKQARPLADKLAALSEGKVMDVSGLHVDGSGAKAINAPGPKSKKVQAGGYRIVSDNKRGVNAAAKLLGDEGVVEAWVAAKATAKPSPKARTSPKKRAAKTPSKTIPVGSAATSPIGSAKLPSLPARSSSRGTLPRVKVPTVGSPRRSPPM